jgi:hypothetical protein
VSDFYVTQTVTTTSVSQSDVYIEVPTTVEETQTITTSYPYIVIIDHTTTTTSYYPTTVVSVTTYTDLVSVIVCIIVSFILVLEHVKSPSLSRNEY